MENRVRFISIYYLERKCQFKHNLYKIGLIVLKKLHHIYFNILLCNYKVKNARNIHSEEYN